MKLLILDTSSKAASAALWEDGVLRGEAYQNTGHTHSATSLPMAEQLLAGCGWSLSEVDGFAGDPEQACRTSYDFLRGKLV